MGCLHHPDDESHLATEMLHKRICFFYVYTGRRASRTPLRAPRPVCWIPPSPVLTEQAYSVCPQVGTSLFCVEGSAMNRAKYLPASLAGAFAVLCLMSALNADEKKAEPAKPAPKPEAATAIKPKP